MVAATRRDVPIAKAAHRDRERFLGRLIENHSLLLEFRTAKPRSAVCHEFVRRELVVRRRIREMMGAES